MKKYYSAQFDNFPDNNGNIVVEYSDNVDTLSLLLDNQKIPLITAERDQWGVYYTVFDKITISQEDCTRSFIDALIGGLDDMRRLCEYGTTEATKDKYES